MSEQTPLDIEGAIAALADMAASVNASLAAYDLLLRGLYTERATQAGTLPHDAEEEILNLASSLQNGLRRGYPGEDLEIERSAIVLQGFAASLRHRLDALRLK